MRCVLLAASLVLGMMSGGDVLAGDGNPALGQTKATTCTACHGPDGQGTAPIYPVLAGQHAEYLAHALRQYRNGDRDNVIMAGFASGLSDSDIADLAAWYASMEGLKTVAH